MDYTKEEIETRLKGLLHEIFRGASQEDGILSLEYNEKKQECTVKLNVSIIEEDDYIGFSSY